MKVALVYDRLNKIGGAERVLLSLHQIYPDAPIFTLVYEPSTARWAKEFKVFPSMFNQISLLRKKHEWLAPFAIMAFESFDLSEYDLIISVTSSDAKSVITKPCQLHLCYCLTPTRYFWSGNIQYREDIKFKIIPKWLLQYFRTTDLLTSKRPDQYIAISNEVKSRISKYYKRKSSVIYPSIDDKFYTKEFTKKEDRKYYLWVGRLVSYKRPDLAVKAFNLLKKPLIIAGEGGELGKLKQIAGKTITFLGKVDDRQLIKLYQNAKAVIFPQDEDFGLVPLEAQASGTPVIALAKGGALETIKNKKTGLFFKHQTVGSLAKAISKFEKLNLDPKDCSRNALRFSRKNFIKKFSSEVGKLWSDHLSHSSA